ncbi:MAG: SDR family oxidoreductase [Anaerolineales bacterium]|nr:SDR family oxidoreductase [Anaerolineales bacterium]
MILKNKNAIIYGAGGAVGRTMAHAFARENTKVFLAGHTLAKLKTVAEEIADLGGSAEAAEVDALDQESVEKHAAEVVKKAGSLDVSFNLISLGDEQGTLLVDMTLDEFLIAPTTALRTQFLTMTAAARHMTKQKSGVMLALTANVARMPSSYSGGFGVACATIEAMCRQVAVEVGADGVRVICLRSAGSPDAPGVHEALSIHAKNSDMTFDEFHAYAARGSMLKRMPWMAEIANVAAFMASDGASAMTASVANLTCGALVD